MTLTPFLLSLFPSFVAVSVAQEARTQVAVSQDSLREARAELAEIRLLLGAQRDYAKARARLDTLAEALAPSTATGASELRSEVERLTLEVRRALGEAPSESAAGEDKVDLAIQNALLIGDFAFVTSMGTRAVPALQEAIRRQPDVYPSDSEGDPLTLLVKIDALAASELIGELVARDSFLWKKRALRAMHDGLAGSHSLWSAEAPQRWLGAGFTRMAERYVDDPEVERGALDFLTALARRGERSSVLEPALGRALRGTDTERRRRAMSQARRGTLGVEFFELLLEEPAGDLRAYAAETLCEDFRESRALLAHAADAEVEVRAQAARWFAWTDPLTWEEAELGALERMLQDPAKEVRGRVLETLMGLPTESEVYTSENIRFTRSEYTRPLPAPIYRSMVGQGIDDAVVLVVTRLPEPLCFELAEAIARSSSAAARGALVPLLDDLPFWRAPEVMLSLLEILLGSSPPVSDRSRLESMLGHVGLAPGGGAPLLRWLLAHPDPERLARIHAETPFSASRLARLEAHTALAFLVQLFPIDRDEVREFFVHKRRGPGAWTPEHSRASRPLVQDAKLPLGLRLVALNGLLNDGEIDADFGDLARAVLQDPTWRTEPAWERDVLVGLLRRDLGATANALILFLLRSPSLPEFLALSTVQCIEPTHEGAAEIVREVIERRFDEEGWEDPVESALWAMKDSPPLADRAILARAIRDERFRRTALGVIGELRDPQTLPLVSEALAQPVPAYEFRWAAEALFGFLDAEAFEPLLLAAAKVPDEDVRDQCLAHLEKIRAYQEARDRWAAREASGQVRERVIGELVAQLGAKSEEVRVQAIRALATWEAREAMPKLIELTTSGSKTVAAAAREALERLNAGTKD